MRCCDFLVVTSAALLMATGSAAAATFTVKNTNDSGTDSLREAITQANAAGGADTITFAIPGAGPHTITLASALPPISGTLTIDGYTQTGSVANTNAPDQGGLNTQLMIEISGNGVVSSGFVLDTGSVTLTVQGVAMNRFNGDAIVGNGNVAGTSQLNVYGNFLGTAINGSALPSTGNLGSGVRVGDSSAQIGGPQPWQRNLLSGNGGSGVYIGSPTTAVVEANLIGTDASGTLPVPNGGSSNWAGVYLSVNLPNIRIGCTGAGCASAASRNVISGNWVYGINLFDIYGQNSGGLEIKGNYIGTDWTGTNPLPNGQGGPAYCPAFCGGITFQGSASVKPVAVIGGFGSGEANLIAFNNGPGIRPGFDVAGASFDSRANFVQRNHGVGHANIDIGAAGPTPNDVDDVDGGANLGQNSPHIISASQSGNTLTVTYVVDTATANATYPLRIDFYANVWGGSGQLLAQDSYPASSAQTQRTVMLAVPNGVSAIPFVATATDADGHTSEFAPAFDVIFATEFE